MDIGAVGDIDVFNGEGIEDFGGGSLADSIGQVVVADEEEDSDAASSETIDAPGELPLLGLARLTALVGVAAEKHEVYPIFQRVVDKLVEGG